MTTVIDRPTGRDRHTPCLRDRPLEPTDREAFRAGFALLSPDSRYLRFGVPKPRLTERELTYLVDVDHHDHEALVAFECTSERPVGVVRFVRLPGRPEAADVAVSVLDAWQGHGVGARLLARIAERAAAEGVRVLHAEVLPANRRALRLLRHAGFRPTGRDGGWLTYERVLDDAAPVARAA